MLKSWWWSWPHADIDIKVNITTAAVFNAARQRFSENERGGQLFADLTDPKGINLIATAPHPSDLSSRIWVEFNRERCQNEIASANKLGFRLVGYWHTHPQKIPTPSNTDLASFKEFSFQNRDSLPCPLAVIVGNAITPNGIRAWVLKGNNFLEGVFRREHNNPFESTSSSPAQQ